MTAVVRGLTVYPLKSGGGTALTSAELRPEGFRYDREFMLAGPDGRFLSHGGRPGWRCCARPTTG